MAVTQYVVGGFLTFGRLVPWQAGYSFHLLVLSTVLIAAGGYIINDYFDVKIDRINKPDRVWIGKTISRRSALLIHQVFSSVGILLVAPAGWKALALHTFSVGLLWFYASGFKKKPFIGNFVVAFLTALVIAEIALIYDPGNRLIYMYAVFAFFINLIREIVKDMEDIRGDEHHGAKTLPILYGIHRTKNLLYLLMAVFLISMFFFIYKVEDIRIRLFSGFLLTLWAILLFFIVQADRKVHFSRISDLCKWFILAGLVSVTLFRWA